jgi:integrase
MIAILTSSGLRIGTLASLTLGYIALEEEIPRITVRRKPGRKVSRKLGAFATFISPEAKKLLEQYLKYRRDLGEEVTERSQIITSEMQEELGKVMRPIYLSQHWGRLLKRVSLDDKNGGPWYEIRLHTLRKYFETMCINAGVKTAYREFWLGHTGRHMEESYFRGEVETHRGGVQESYSLPNNSDFGASRLQGLNGESEVFRRKW